ncbi:hypothetical protein AXG93_2632s1130 [Marchantia polymorpha subsp. ruderalis]|uniref:Uncharacterized protein n=1 Tax=Marchantia polymorpha subsp. ruderalis TaxID=1480154 RepID=A0A176VV41_MARPO|nr:hypothetical protein AXG93_2632s1130 [Marchantia polymorpha subsp. ruderalis]
MSPRGAGFATTDLVCMGLDRMSSNRDALSKSRSCVGYDIVDGPAEDKLVAFRFLVEGAQALEKYRLGRDYSQSRCHKVKRNWMSRLLNLTSTQTNQISKLITSVQHGDNRREAKKDSNI